MLAMSVKRSLDLADGNINSNGSTNSNNISTDNINNQQYEDLTDVRVIARMQEESE